MKKTRFLWLGFVMVLVLVAIPFFSALALDTMPPPIDPQSWKLQEDMLWNELKPNPVIDWMKEMNPAGLINPMGRGAEPIKGALVLVDFWDRPFIATQELNTDLLGYYLYDEFGKFESSMTKNPVIHVNADDYAEWIRDYLNKNQEINRYRSIDEFWRENSYGKWAVTLESFGPYHLPGFEFEFDLSYTNWSDLPPVFRRGTTGASGYRNMMNEGIACTLAEGIYLGDYDFFFILHSGYDESSVWLEFGQMQWAKPEDVPYEYGPGAKMEEVEEILTANPEYLLELETTMTSFSSTTPVINGYVQSFLSEQITEIKARKAAGTLNGYEFKFPAADWEWQKSYSYGNAGPTRYVPWSSWIATVSRWSSSGSSTVPRSPENGGGSRSIRQSGQGESDGMGVFAHEFGHITGLSDNYEATMWTQNVSPKTEYWDLMSRGDKVGPGGYHSRWMVPSGREAGSSPAHYMMYSKQRANYYDPGDLLQLSVAQLKAGTPVVSEIVARNVPMNNGGLYPWLERYGLVSPNYYKAIELTFDTANPDVTPLVTSGYSLSRWRAGRTAIEVVDRTGYDSFAADHGVLISRIQSGSTDTHRWVVDSHLYNINLVDYYLNGVPTYYCIGHSDQLNDALFHVGKSFVDTGYYKGDYTVNNNGTFESDSGSKHGSARQWEERNGRDIMSGDTVNEWHDSYNKLHFYILDKHENPGKYGYFLSYSVGVLHDDGAPVGGELEIKLAGIETEAPGRVAVVSYDIKNTGDATDIVRVATDGDFEGVLLNDLYAIGAGETVTVSYYVELPADILDTDLSGLEISFTASSESNSEKEAAAIVAVEDMLTNFNFNAYFDSAKSKYTNGEIVYVDIMLQGNLNFTMTEAKVAYDADILEYVGYENLSGWMSQIQRENPNLVTIRNIPAINMNVGAPCVEPVKLITLKFKVKYLLELPEESAISFETLNIYSTSANPHPSIAPEKDLSFDLKVAGNEHLMANIEKFPDMLDYETGQTKPIFSNANDRVINEVVWIEAPLDTDLDGKRDLQRVVIRRPIETLPENGGLKCPAIINISPYVTTTSSGVMFIGFSDRIYEGFPEQGPAATRFQHTAFSARPAGVEGVLNDRSHWTKIYGPENDKSYRALRDVTERRVGKGAEATVARYQDLLDDGMLMATSYTAQQAANYPWLPPARVPVGSQRDGTPFATSPGSAGPWSTANMIPRGYAVLQYRITGSDNADGFLQYGMYQESLAGASVVDWLNGRVRGYADREGLVEVKAYWATGEAAASGTSYEGTMPMAAAVTGVEGLRTIFTGAPVTNAYNYYRENAMPYAPGGYVGEDLNAITMYCAGRMVNTGAPAHPTSITSSTWDTFWDWLLYLTSEQDATTGDYSPAWDERNPLSFGYDFRQDLGVIMGHGFNDGNVKFRHTALLNETLKFYGVDVVKGLFHQAGHSMGNSRAGAWTTTAVMYDWADHYLYGVENNIVERTPTYSLEGNRLGAATSGTWTNYDTWPRGTEYQKFYPTGGRVGSISTTSPATSTSVTFQDDYLTKVTYPQTYDDTYYTNGVNGLVANRQHLRANGVNSANGALANLLLVRGQGANSALGSSQRPTWRNMLVGGLEGVTTAWSGSEQRLLYSSAALTAQFSKTKEIKDRVLFLNDIKEDFTISGFTKMTAEIAASKDVGAISVMLLEWGASSVKIVAMGSIDVRNPNPDGTIAPDVPGLANINKGGNWHANYLFQPADIVPYGSAVPAAANFNSYTWEMDVTEYTFTAGNQMGIILYGSDPDFTYITRDATEFTVNIGPNTYMSLPVVSPIVMLATAVSIEEEEEKGGGELEDGEKEAAIAAYDEAHAAFCAYYNTATWAFLRELFADYTPASVMQAESIMGAAGSEHAALLAVYGKLDAGRFDITDDLAALREGARILNTAIEIMWEVLN